MILINYAVKQKPFLASARIALSPWADPTGATRLRFTEAFGFRAYPTTYLIGS
jgi:hypothetical protein